MNNRRSILLTWVVCEFLNKVAGSLNNPFYLQQKVPSIYGNGLTTAVGELYNGSAITFPYDTHDAVSTGDRDPNSDPSGFFGAFVESLSVTMVTELGDNTFFTAAILAMQYPRIIVFLGSFSALTVMNALSVSLALVLTVIPRVYTFYASTGMLVYFGTKMLREAYSMSPTAQNGFDAMQSDMDEKKKRMDNCASGSSCSGGDGTNTRSNGLDILLKVFTTILLAEFGDRSQLTTFVMSAQKNALGIIVGGTVGRIFSTGTAVIGGRMIAQRVSVRTVTAVGGLLFLMFAFSSSMPNDKNMGLVSV